MSYTKISERDEKPIVAEAFHIIKVHFHEKGQERGPGGWKRISSGGLP